MPSCRPRSSRAILLLAALVAGCRSFYPHVVTAVVPYTAIMVLDTADHSLGRSGCDLNGQSVIFLNPRIAVDRIAYVLTRERVHVEQARMYPGGCFAYTRRYHDDESFRLHVEADAFCGVYEAQLMSGNTPNPTLAEIVTLLTPSERGYSGSWTVDDVKAAMRCWPPQ